MVTYKVIGNTEENRTTSLAEFLRNIKYLFAANAVPSFEIVNRLCSKPDPRLDGGRVRWKPFEIDEQEYCEAIDILREDFGLEENVVPNDVDDPFKWVVWQYQLTHKVPYSEHLKLAETESMCKLLLDEAVESSSEEKLLELHIQYIRVSSKLDDFLGGYLNRKG